MITVSESVERHHKLIIAAMAFAIVFFLFACTFHEVVPVCHWLFGCDHGMH